MPIDPSIALSVKPVNVDLGDIYSKALGMKNMMQQQEIQKQALLQNQMNMEKAQKAELQARKISEIYKAAADPTTGSIDPLKVRTGLATQGFAHMIPDYDKDLDESQKRKVEQQKREAEVVMERMKNVAATLAPIAAHPAPTLDMLSTRLKQAVDSGVMTPEAANQGFKEAFAAFSQGGPEALRQQINSGLAGIQEQHNTFKFLAGETKTIDTGGNQTTVKIDPITGKTTVLGQMSKTLGPGQQEQINISRAHLALAQRKEARDAEEAAANGKELAERLYNGDIATVRGSAIWTKAMPYMKQVEKEHGAPFDPTKGPRIQKVLADFTTGKTAQNLKSLDTALMHSEQLEGMVDALNNGNMRVFNTLRQEYLRQTGEDPGTNIRTVGQALGAEFVRAVSGVGGGIEERLETEKKFSDVGSSPKQLKNAINEAKKLLAGRAIPIADALVRGTNGRYDPREYLLSNTIRLLDQTKPDWGNQIGYKPNQSQTPVVKSQAEYDRLPIGAEYVTASGQKARKR